MQNAQFNGLPIFQGEIVEDIDGVLRVSLVDKPAVQSHFLAFNEQRTMQTFSVASEEKRLIRGVLMRADYPILRRVEGFEYYIVFNAQTIRKVFEKYLREHRSSNVNIMHEQGSEVQGVDLVQIFFKDTASGINPVGFEEIEEGSAFGEYHVTNDAVWAAVKDGTFKGFSIEGYFREVEIENNQLNRSNMNFRKVFVRMRDVVTDKAVLLWDGEEDLKAGDAVYVEEEGERKAAPTGDYMTEDGKVISVVDGKVAEIKDPKAEVASEEGAEMEAEEHAEEINEERPGTRDDEDELWAMYNDLAKKVEELAAKVEALDGKNEQMAAENVALREQMAKFAEAPAAPPAHEQFRDDPQRGEMPKGARNAASIIGARR